MPTIARLINNLQVTLGNVSGYPSVSMGTPSPAASVHITSPNSAVKTLIVQGITGQSASIFEVQSDTNTLVGVSASGNLTISGRIVAGSTPVTITTSTGFLDATKISGIIPLANGGMGVSSLTDKGVVLVNGTALTSLVGTSSGQILSWDGTAWGAITPLSGGNVASGASATTGKITKWQGSTIITDSVITEASGNIGINKGTSLLGQLHVQSGVITNPTFILQRFTGQTANLASWYSENGTTLLGGLSNIGTMGLGVAPGTDSILKISGTLASTGTNLFAINTTGMIPTPSTGFNATFINSGGAVDASAGTVPDVYGHYINTLTKFSTGTITRAHALYVNQPSAATTNYTAYFGGQVNIGAEIGQNMMMYIAGISPLVASSDSHGLYINPSLSPDNTKNAIGLRVSGIVVPSTTTANATGVQIDSFTQSGGTVTNATGLVISNPTIGASNYAADIRGIVGIGAGNTSAIDSSSLLSLSGTVVSPSGAARAIRITTTLTPISGSNAIAVILSPSVSSVNPIGAVYGLYINPVTNGGTGVSSVGYGAYINAPTSSTVNYAAYFSGNVGINSSSASVSLYANSVNPSSTAITARGAASQTANIQEWWTSAALQTSIGADGTMFINPTAPANALLSLRSIASPVRNVLEIQNSSGTVLTAFGPNGNLGVGSGSSVSTNTQLIIGGTISPGSGGGTPFGVFQTANLVNSTSGTFSAYFLGGQYTANTAINQNAVALNINPSLATSNSGTYANYWGIYAQHVAPVGASKVYGAYFADPVGIGTSTPTYTLQVAGTLGINTDATIGNNLIVNNNLYVGGTGSFTGSVGLTGGATLGSNLFVNGNTIQFDSAVASMYLLSPTIGNGLAISSLSITDLSFYSGGANPIRHIYLTDGLVTIPFYHTYDSQIANDTSGYPGLCILGNSTLGSGYYSTTTRVVRLFDDVYVNGSLHVIGAITKGSGTFKIDSPKNPQEKNLYHAFLESPQYDLVYRGNVKLVGGKATVNLDTVAKMEEGTFALLVKNVDVFVTNKTSFSRVMPSDVVGNTFTIFCEDQLSDDTVTWMVIAERNDPYIRNAQETDENGSLIVEEMKKELPQQATNPSTNDKTYRESDYRGYKGHYLHPEAFEKKEV